MNSQTSDIAAKRANVIAFGALFISVCSIIVGLTTVYSRSAYSIEGLNKAVGEPGGPYGLYALVEKNSQLATEANSISKLAHSNLKDAKETSFKASQYAQEAKGLSLQAKKESEAALQKAESASAKSKESIEQASGAKSDSLNAINRSVPVGTILAWVPTPEFPKPTGTWSICNGKNGTPDLQHRFLYGVKNIDEAQSTGGRKKIPTDGAHKHGGTTGEAPETGKPKENGDDGHHTHKHRHSIIVDGRHNHGGDNLPPYYTVVFIMKTKD